MRRGHDLEEAHRRFVAARKCSMRTAQRHSKARTPEWIEFCEVGAGAVAVTVANPGGQVGGGCGEVELPPAPESVNKPVSEMTPEEWAEAETWKLLRKNAQTAADSRDAMEKSAAMRHHAELLTRWQAARRGRQAAEERDRKVVRIEEFYAVKSVVARVAGLIAALPELAPMLNRADPGEARQGLLSWLENQFNPAVRSVEVECEHRLASAA